MADYTTRQHDTAEYISATLKKNGAAVNLTGAKEVLLHMRLVGAPLEIVNITFEIVSAAAGTIQHRWESSEVAIAGSYEFEWEVVWTEGNRPSSFPTIGHYSLLIEPDIA